MAAPDFHYELVPVAASDAVQKCLALRTEGQGCFTPILLESPEDYLLEGDDLAALQRQLPTTLAAAQAISVPQFFAQRRACDPSFYDELEAGSWPDEPYRFEPYLPQQAEELFIAKVPASRSYEALAHIGFGGWNDCPTDEEHVAVLRYWHERHGANLIAIGGDMIECTVDRPPSTREQALDLAREHLIYAPGTLGEFAAQGSSVPELAATLLNSRHWLFWWD